MTHFIETGQDAERRTRPVRFDNTLVYEFERQTGRKFVTECNALFNELRRVGKSLGTDDVAEAAGGVSMVRFVDIMYHAFRVGALKDRQPIDFTELDVAEWLDDHTVNISLVTWLAEANATPAGLAEMETDDDDTGKKKNPAASPAQ